jgi:hypothetical protein
MISNFQRKNMFFLSNATRFPLHILQKDLTKKYRKHLFVRRKIVPLPNKKIVAYST